MEKQIINNETFEADILNKLMESVYEALKTYSNVHRGSGHFSMVTTQLYEQARTIVRDYLGLNKGCLVIFCNRHRADIYKKQLDNTDYQSISSSEIGLPLGIYALAIRKQALKKITIFQTGGGTARLIGSDWTVWAHLPDRFEAGTPAIINTITFAKALMVLKREKLNSFTEIIQNKQTALDIPEQITAEMQGKALLDALRNSLIGRDFKVPTTKGQQMFINLDNAASTPTFEPIWQMVKKAWLAPRAEYPDFIKKTKAICAQTLTAPEQEFDILFTSNSTEAINTVSENVITNINSQTEPVIVNTILEHNSNELPWRHINGSSHITLSVDAEGFVDIQELERLLIAYNRDFEYGKKRIQLFTISGASNVLGTYNNLKEISDLVHKYNAHLLVDAAQLIAHKHIDMHDLGIDYLVFSGHKMYAPFGSGALIVKKGLLRLSKEEIESLKQSGEENIGGIAAIGQSFQLLQKIGFDTIREEEQKLSKQVHIGLGGIENIKYYNVIKEGLEDKRGGVFIFNMEKIISHKTGRFLAQEYGIGIRSGCHCSHRIVKHTLGIPPGLEKFQRFIVSLFPKLELPGVARISLGLHNTQNDIDMVIAALKQMAANSITKDKKSTMKNFIVERTKLVYQ